MKRAGSWHWTLNFLVVHDRKGLEDRLRSGECLACEILVLLCLTDGFLEGLQKEGKEVPSVQDEIKWLRVESQGVN